MREDILIDEDDIIQPKKNIKCKKKTNNATSLGSYILLLVVFIIICISGRTVGEYNYYTANGISKLLLEQDFADDTLITQGEKNFESISSVDEVWIFAKQILIPSLLNNERVGLQNILLGGIRFRQLRVKSENCSNKLFPKCYPKWSKENEDKSALSNFSPKITWTSISQNHEQANWYGRVDTYSGSGFIIDLPKNKTESLVILNNLETNNFLDEQTRVLFIDFNLYNPNLNIHTIGRLSIEMPHTGGMQPFKEIKTWRLDRYGGNRGIIVLVFEIILLILICIITFVELRNIISNCWKNGNENNAIHIRCGETFRLYFENRWNIIDIINLIFFWVTISSRIYEINYNKSIDLYSIDSFTSLRHIQSLYQMESNIQLVNGFLLWIKMFKYFTFSNRIRFLFAMFERTATDLFIFMIVLFIFVLAFATSAFLSFSSDIEQFRSFNSSILNLIRYTVSEMDLEKLTDSSLVIGPMFFVIWSLLMILILANVFIAIMCDAYNGLNDKDDKFNVRQLSFSSIFKPIKDFLSNPFSFYDTNNDGKLSKTELTQISGMNEKNAQMVIDIFDKNNDKHLDEDEIKTLENVIKRKETYEMDDKSLSKFLNEIAKENNFNLESKSNDEDIRDIIINIEPIVNNEDINMETFKDELGASRPVSPRSRSRSRPISP